MEPGDDVEARRVDVEHLDRRPSPADLSSTRANPTALAGPATERAAAPGLVDDDRGALAVVADPQDGSEGTEGRPGSDRLPGPGQAESARDADGVVRIGVDREEVGGAHPLRDVGGPGSTTGPRLARSPATTALALATGPRGMPRGCSTSTGAAARASMPPTRWPTARRARISAMIRSGTRALALAVYHQVITPGHQRAFA